MSSELWFAKAGSSMFRKPALNKAASNLACLDCHVQPGGQTFLLSTPATSVQCSERSPPEASLFDVVVAPQAAIILVGSLQPFTQGKYNLLVGPA